MSFAAVLCPWIGSGIVAHVAAYLLTWAKAPPEEWAEIRREAETYFVGAMIVSLLLGPLSFVVLFFDDVRKGTGSGT